MKEATKSSDDLLGLKPSERENLAAALSSTLRVPPKIEIPPPPSNPVHGTNERLDGLLERFDWFETIATQTVELVHSMNTAASGLLDAFAKGAQDTEKFSRRSIWIAFMALLVAILTPIFQVWREGKKSGQQDEDTKQIVQTVLQQIRDAQQNTFNETNGAMFERLNRAHEDEAELAKAISALSKEIRALKENPPARGKK